MRRGMVSVAVLLCSMLMVDWVWLGATGTSQEVLALPFEGHIRMIKIDLCGLQPGMCQGSMVLVREEGGEVFLAIEPGMRIKRGGQVATIDELGAGDYVKVQAIQLGKGAAPQIIFIEVMTP
jgi:hypothetical protein